MSFTGHHHTDKTRAKLTAALIGNKRCLGIHASDEARVRMSASRKGSIFSLEHREKISAALMGKPKSLEHRANMSIANMGRKVSPETRAKISAAEMGRIMSPETRAKIAIGNWKGGPRVSHPKLAAKHRRLGFVPLNNWFAGCEGHHIDKMYVIYIPKKLHHSVYHNVWTGKGMDKINALAREWLAKENDAP